MTPRPLRYLLIGTHVPPSGQGGGMVRYVVQLARGLAARDDVELHVLAGAGAQGAFTHLVDADRVHTLPGRGPLVSAVERLQPHDRRWQRQLLEFKGIRRLCFDDMHGLRRTANV